MPSHYVSVREAARILGVSRRTVDRRISAGALSTVVRDGVRLVVLEDTPDAPPAESPAPAPAPPDAPALMSEHVRLRARLESVEEERDHPRHTVDAPTGTVDRLTIGMAQLTGVVVEQKGIGRARVNGHPSGRHGAPGGASGSGKERRGREMAEIGTFRTRDGEAVTVTHSAILWEHAPGEMRQWLIRDLVGVRTKEEVVKHKQGLFKAERGGSELRHGVPFPITRADGMNVAR